MPLPLVGAFFLAGLADTDASIPLGWALSSALCAHREEEMLKAKCHKKQFGIRQIPWKSFGVCATHKLGGPGKSERRQSNA